MSTTRLMTLAVLIPLLAVAAGCGKHPATGALQGKVVATVNGAPITDNDLTYYIRLREHQVGAMPDKNKERQLALNELINQTLLAQYATDQKLDRDPEVAALLRRAHTEVLVQAVTHKMLHDSPITDVQLKQRFDQEVQNTYKTEFRVRHIVVRDEDQANKIIDQLKQGASFAALAKAKSLDRQSGARGGEIGWVNQGMGLPDTFFTALTTMKKGEVSPTPVHTQYGWHVIQVEDTRPLKLPTFAEFIANPESRARLTQKILEERVAALVQTLHAAGKISITP